MKDPRLIKLARLLTRYSLKLKPGNVVAINGSALAAPLMRECYREALRCGAYPFCDVALDGIAEIFVGEASEDQLRWVSPLQKFKMERIDAFISIRAEENTKSLSQADPKRLATISRARKPIFDTYLRRFAKGALRWVGTQWPCQASAQDAEMSLGDYEEFVFSAGHLDDADPIKTWQRISKEQQALTDFLNRARQVRVVAENTDITYSCRGRTWINCCGHENFPDGEVFTGPIESSATGHVKFSFPAVHQGREVHGAHVWFENGKVVKSTADKDEDFLHAMIAMDKGSCYLGEAAIGTNYNIQRYTKNTLFDEKIGGTVHFALGAGFIETGSKNKSGLHWDMVCDLRKGGEIWVDGELIQKNGRFLNSKFPQP
jgi:aminopeptidase